MEYNFPQDPIETDLSRDWEYECHQELQYQAALHADTGCTPEEIANPPYQEFPLGSSPPPVIERKPVQLVYRAQGNLFEEIA